MIHGNYDRIFRLQHKRIFFIVGYQKSRTTWGQHMLDSHSEICCNDEAYLVPVLLPILKHAIAVYNNNQKVGQDGQFATRT